MPGLHDLVGSSLRPLADLVSKEAVGIIEEASQTSTLVPLGELEVLANVVSLVKPQRSIEVGLASGSTALVILACGEGTHVALDPFQGNLYGMQAVQRIERAGCGDRFMLLPQHSHLALPKLLSEGARFDFAFIDGSHKFDDTFIEWFYIDRLIDIGGLVTLDDCHWPMVSTVARFVAENLSYELVKHTERTWSLLKTGPDTRRWFDFKPFDIPWGPEQRNQWAAMDAWEKENEARR